MQIGPPQSSGRSKERLTHLQCSWQRLKPEAIALFFERIDVTKSGKERRKNYNNNNNSNKTQVQVEAIMSNEQHLKLERFRTRSRK